MIFEIKSPFNFIFEPEFSTGSPVGDPVGAVIEPPETVARVLYVLASNHNYVMPEIPPEVVKQTAKNIDYIL